MKKILTNWIIWGIMIITILTRLPFLDRYPYGFSGDEAGQGYTAYSLLKTGRDEWGEFLPLFPRTFGDYKAPLYSYLLVPIEAIFGLNIFSVRLLAAITGIFTVIIVYFLSLELFRNKSIALYSSFFLAINPWHIQLSRTASESDLGILFFCLGLWFLLRGYKSYWVGIFWGLALYSYHSFRVFILLFIVAGLLLKRLSFKKNRQLLIIFFIFLLPLLLHIKLVLTRASDVGIFSRESFQSFYNQRFIEERSLQPTSRLINRFFDNRFTFIGNRFFNNYVAYFSPSFLFSESRDDENYLNFAGFGLVYPVSLVLWLLAIPILKSLPNYWIIFVWILLAPIPAAMAGGVHANRAITYLPMTAILSAIGAWQLINLVSKRWRAKLFLANLFLVSIFLASTIFFIQHYLTTPVNYKSSLRSGYPEVFQQVLNDQNQYQKIIISRSFTVPQIYIAFFGKVDPSYYQQQAQDWLRYEKLGYKYIDQLGEWNLGNFTFKNLNWHDNESKLDYVLIVGRGDEFPKDVKSIYDIQDSQGDVIYRLVPSSLNPRI